MKKIVYQSAIAIAWLAMMTWLIWFKVLPAFVGGEAPGYEDELVEIEKVEATCWRIHWNDKPIGYAVSKPFAIKNDTSELRGVISLQKLPVDEIGRAFLGVFISMFNLPDNFEMDMTIANRMQFDSQRDVQHFETRVATSLLPQPLQIRGDRIENNNINLTAGLVGPNGEASNLVEKEIQLPRGETMGNGLAPRSKMKNLKIGQSWTMPVYRPFPPDSPVEVMQARVERYELIHSGGKGVNAMRIVFRNQAGTGISASREPVAIVWVDDDGTVIQQEVKISGVTFLFTLERGDAKEEQAKLLETETFDKFFQ